MPIMAMTPRAQPNLLALDADDAARTVAAGTTEGKGPSIGGTGSRGGSAAGPLTGAAPTVTGAMNRYPTFGTV